MSLVASQPIVLIVMGVSGSGKSTIAEALAARLGWTFQEGDVLHPPSNIQKMHAGIPLDDTDRGPWLAAVRAWIDARVAAGEPGIVTCSALKRRYRAGLVGGRAQVRLLYLKASADVLASRLHQRRGHFMPPALLQSQLDTLEEPGADERPIEVDVESAVSATVADALAAVRTASADAAD